MPRLDTEGRLPAKTRAVLVVNTRARKGRRSYSAAKRLLQRDGMELEAAYPVRDPSRLPEVVQEAIAAGASLIIIGGGDGSISSVAHFFANTQVVMGIIPLGTANSFARSLDIPLALEDAVRVIATGEVAPVDLGAANQDCFANAVSLGIAPAISRSRPHQLKRYLGRFGYLIAAALSLPRYRPFACRITLNEGASVEVERTLDVLIANGRYKGGMLVAEDASLQSQELVIRIIKGSSWIGLMRAWARIWARLPIPERELLVLHTRAATITTEPSEYVSVDGEVVTRTPLELTVLARALRVLVPAQ